LNGALAYLSQCTSRGLTESADVTRPPTAEEFLALMGYLAEQGIEATLVGSAAVVHHLRNSPHGFRPTFDVDIHVNKQLPPLPAGWRKDQTAVGVNSWISPSGGIVDFLTPGHRFPSGEIVPRRVGRQTASDGNYAVAEINDLIRIKLDSMRDKDLHDVLAMVRHLGYVPSAASLGGRLTDTQQQNLDLVRVWISARPQGRYGE